MSEFAAKHEQSLDSAAQPVGFATGAAMYRKPISADSFRRLTALLKGAGATNNAVPEIVPAEPQPEMAAPPEYVTMVPEVLVPLIAAAVAQADAQEQPTFVEAPIITTAQSPHVVEEILARAYHEPQIEEIEEAPGSYFSNAEAPFHDEGEAALVLVEPEIEAMPQPEALAVPEVLPELVAEPLPTPAIDAEAFAPMALPLDPLPVVDVASDVPAAEIIETPQPAIELQESVQTSEENEPAPAFGAVSEQGPEPEPEPETVEDIAVAIFGHPVETRLQDLPQRESSWPIIERRKAVAAPVPAAAPVAVEANVPEPNAATAEEQPAPKLKTKSLLIQKPRDAFAISPALVPPKPAPVAIQQTPEQEQEAAELARSLLDMMAASAGTGLPQERALAADTLLRMLPRLPLKSLIMLAERVRLMEAPPHLLLAKLLANPNIAVAGPLLEDCMQITDEDLAMVIAEGDVDKIRLIGRRRRLSRAITTELVKTKESSVLLTLVRNQGAEIPQESFFELGRLASEHTELLAPLCTRTDLPVPLAFELIWPAPVQLRRYLLNRFLTDSETLTKILKIARESDGEENQEHHVASLEDLQAALAMAGAGDVDQAAQILARFGKINPATATRILADDQGEPLVALLKVCGLPRGKLLDVLSELAKSSSGLLDPAREIDELQSSFDSLSHNKARILLTYWDWAILKSGPYAPLN